MGRAIAKMLSVTGDPEAIGLAVVLALGLFIALLGARYAKFTVAVVGLVVGAELAGRVVMAQGGSAMATAIVGGVGGVALAVAFVLYRSAAAIGLGAALWASFAAMAMPAIDAPDHYMALLPAAVIGGVAGMLLPKFVMTLSTALFGGVAAAACGFALIAKRSCASVVVRVAPDEAFTQGAYNRIYFLGCAALLVTAALVLQDRMSESPRIADK